MQITVLTENNARIDNYLLAEPALSLLIEFDDKKILFDTGYSDVFLKNANALNINLNDITDIVFIGKPEFGKFTALCRHNERDLVFSLVFLVVQSHARGIRDIFKARHAL